VVPGTKAKQTLAWSRYTSYLQSIGITDDTYLEQFNKPQKHRILGAFATAIRSNRFNPGKRDPIKSDHCKSTINCVAQAYRMAGHEDPTLDANGKPSFILQRQFRHFSNTDKPPTQQAAVTGSILRKLHQLATPNLEKTMCDLFIGAFFFAMQSCEYLSVTGTRRTKLLQVKNIRFFKSKREQDHCDKQLHKADTVSITFEFQKKDIKNDTITQHKSTDTLLCPVKIWSRIIKCLINQKETNQNTTVNTYYSEGKSYKIIGSMLLKQLRRATKAIGKEELGFSENQIGLHSARSGAAMAMYLAGIPVYIIMLIGRWSSDAFLLYIRKQVQEFSKNISQNMITNENFFTIPTASIEDPRIRNHPLNHSSRQNIGPGSKDALHTLVSIFH
jgi:hypothetical protein